MLFRKVGRNYLENRNHITEKRVFRKKKLQRKLLLLSLLLF